MVDGLFLPAKTLGGWVWIDAPLRHLTFLARFYNEGTPDHTGEPFVFVDCPFCGGVLPVPLTDDWRLDGEDGG